MLSIKRIIWYLENREQHEIFVSEVRDDILLSRRKRVGPNIFHYMEDFMAQNFADMDE